MGERSGREGGARKGGRVRKPLSQSRVWSGAGRQVTTLLVQIGTREGLNVCAGGRGDVGAQM